MLFFPMGQRVTLTLFADHPPAAVTVPASMKPSAPCAHRWQALDAGWVLVLSGDWRGAAALSLSSAPREAYSAAVSVDAQALQAWDVGLAAALRERLAPLARHGVVLQLESLPQDVRSVLALALPAPGAEPAAAAPASGALARFGQGVQQTAAEALKTTAFLGEVLLEIGRAHV